MDKIETILKTLKDLNKVFYSDITLDELITVYEKQTKK